jgi:predicted secreted protein
MQKKHLLAVITVVLVVMLLSPMQLAYSAAPASGGTVNNFSKSAGAAGGLTRPESGGLTWRVETVVPMDEVLPDSEGVTPAETLRHAAQERLTDPGVSVEIQPILTASGDAALEVILSGGGGLEQFKQVVYTDLAAQLRFPSAPADLRVEANLRPGQAVEIVLDSNLSTGYRWLLDNRQSAAYSPVEDATLAQNGLNDGQSQKQALHLAAGTAGQAGLALVYRRPWEPAQAQTTVTLWLADLPPVLDLSSPHPAASEGQPQPVLAQVGPQPNANPESLPAAFDWRATSKVTPVRDQGDCGSCWAFGSVGIMESAMLIAGEGSPSTLDLSEQYLVSCNTYSFNCVDGGNWSAHDYHYNLNGQVNNPPGAVLESEFPYTHSDGVCARVYNHPYKITGWTYLDPSSPPVVPSVELIKQAIYNYGPLGVSICVADAFQDYHSGVFSTDESS